MKKLVIIGAGDFGREVTSLVERINEESQEWDLIGFVDDNPQIQNSLIEGYPVLGNTSWLKDYPKELYAVCSLGESQTRKKVIQKIRSCNRIRFATLIDPAAILMRGVTVEEGSIICAGTVLAINTIVGNHSIINLNCTIGHDTMTGDFFTAHPGTNISGKVIIDESGYFGTGCKVIQGVHITGDCVFGAGAVILRNIEIPGTYVGVPARKVK